MVPNQNNIVDIIDSSKDSIKIYDTIVSTIIKTTDKYEPSKLSKSQNSIKRMNALISMYIDGLNSSLSILTAKYNGSDSLAQALGCIIEEEKNENGVVISTKTSYRNIEAFQALSTLMTSMAKTIEGIGKIKLDGKTRRSISKNISLMIGTFNFAINEIINEFKNIDIDRLKSIIDMLVTSPETVKTIDKSISNNSREGNKINSHLANDIETIKSGSKMGILDILTKITELISGVMDMKFPNPIKFQVRLLIFGEMFKSAINSLIHIGENIQKENDIESLNTFRDIMYTINSVFIEGDNDHEAALDAIYQLTDKMSQMFSPMIIANKYGFPQLRQLITNILSIDRDESGKKIDSRVELVGWSKNISTTIESVIEITDSIKKLSVSILALNPATALAMQIGLRGFKWILNILIHKDEKNNKPVGLIVSVVEFGQYLDEIDIKDSADKLDSVKTLLDGILGLVGKIGLLALAFPVVLLSYLPALGTLHLIKHIIYLSIHILNVIGKMTGGKEYKNTTIAVSNITKILGLILLMVVEVLGTLVLISLTLPLLTKSFWTTVGVFVIISGLVLLIAGLGWLINKIFAKGFAEQITTGLLLMAGLIGIMLLVTGMLILFAYLATDFFAEGKWLMALAMFGVVAVVTVAVAGIGYLLTVMLPGIMTFAAAAVSLVIAIGALILVGVELKLLADFSFSDNEKDKIRENSRNIIDASYSVIDTIFGNKKKQKQDENSESSRFGNFVRSIFRGPAMMVELILSSMILVMTFISVTLLLLTAAELTLLDDINLDPETINTNVSIVIGTAFSIISMVCGKTPPDPKGVKEEKKGLFGSLFNFLGNAVRGLKGIVEGILSFGFVAMTFLTIGMITLIAKNLKYLEEIKLNKDVVEKKVDTVIGTANSLINHIKESNVEKNDIKKVELTKKFMKQIKKTVKYMSEIGEMNVSGNFDRAVDSYVRFVDKINTVKLENLEAATNMFAKMAEFSKSINGNFEGLADTINEKLMPLLEELNKSLGNTSSSINNISGGTSGATTNTTAAGVDSRTGKPVNTQDYSKIIQSLNDQLVRIQDILTNGEQQTALLT